MSTILLAFYLGAIPVPPARIHTLHVPPANPTLTAAPRCLVAKEVKGPLTIRVWVKGTCPK